MKHRVIGRGPALLFLHGLPTDGRLWDRAARALSRRHTCVLVDLPGLSGSEAPRAGGLDADACVAALEQLRADLGLAAWDLVGHDAGAAIAALYAAGHPDRVRRLVLLSPPLLADFRPPIVMRLLRRKGLGELLAPLLLPLLWRLLLPLALVRPHEAANRRLLQGFAAPYRGPRGRRRFLRLVRWGDPAVVLGRIEARLGAIQAPALVLHGRRDLVIDPSYAERAAALIPGARLRLLDAGHYLALEEPALLAGELARFLGAAAPGRRPRADRVAAPRAEGLPGQGAAEATPAVPGLASALR